MSGHSSLRVEDDGVDDVGLSGHSGHVLLEGGIAVEEQRRLGKCGQVPRDHLAPALDLRDDGGALPVLDHDDDRGHDEEQDEDRPQQELGLE